MAETTRKIAVLTGDIVGSTELGPDKLESAMAALAECAEVQAKWHGESLRLTRNRGDGWQVVLARPEMALRSALAFRAAIRALGKEFDTYIGIALGNGPVQINDDLNEMVAPTFNTSGQLLEIIKKRKSGFANSVRMELSPSGPATSATILADYIAQSWTPAQATAILMAMDDTQPMTLTDIGEALGKTRQAIKKSLDGAGFDHIAKAVRFMELGTVNHD